MRPWMKIGVVILIVAVAVFLFVMWFTVMKRQQGWFEDAERLIITRKELNRVAESVGCPADVVPGEVVERVILRLVECIGQRQRP